MTGMDADGWDTAEHDVLWTEDAACRHDPDTETTAKAWLRLFGEDLNALTSLADCDHGDAFGFLHPGGRIVWNTCEGGCITRLRAHAPRHLAPEGDKQ